MLCYAKSLQSCPTLCNPIDSKTLLIITVLCDYDFQRKRKWVSQSCPTLCDPWTAACQTPLSMGFPGKNTGVGYHFLFQRIFLTQGSNPALQADSLPSEPQGKVKRKLKISFDFQKETEILIVNLTIFRTRRHGVPGISIFLICKLLYICSVWIEYNHWHFPFLLYA